MELFKETNIDFLGKKALTLGLSALLIAATFISLAAKGGPKLGIDFRGGTLMYVKFAGTPPVQQIRNALQSRISGEVTVQELEAGSREIIIGTELKGERELEAARQQIQRTLSDTLGNLGGKADLNNIGAAELAGRLRSAGLAEEQTQKVAADILAYRDRTKGGVLSSLNDVSSVPGVTPQVVSALQREAGVAPFTIRQVEIVGPKAGKDLQRQAIYATLGALAGMLVYIAFRFEFIAGVAAVLAIIHDTIITLGFFSFFDREINLNVIAALLTLIGYSMNDKIVVFDRVRENIKLMRREPFYSLVNRSINQTLSRTMLTAGPTLLTTLALYFLGGPVLEGIAFALFIGILVGTYSSIFIASAILVWWHQYSERRKLATSGPGSARDAVRPATTVKTAK